jgi:DNA-binding NarL/FixJ family response regulator
MGTLRLLVARSNEIARKGLCALVREQPGWDLAAEASDGREAVQRTKQIKPDVAIMDIDMPSLNGLDATRQITKAALQTQDLLLFVSRLGNSARLQEKRPERAFTLPWNECELYSYWECLLSALQVEGFH